MTTQFSNFMAKLADAEGGFVNHPNDPGGATNRGITIANWKEYGYDKDGDGDIDVDDLRFISEADAQSFYYDQFWKPMLGNSFKNADVAEVVIDHAVNAGKWRATKMLQYILNKYYNANLAQDGVMGPNTLRAANLANQNTLFNKYVELRKNYYNYRANNLAQVPEFIQNFLSTLRLSPSDSAKAFINGWLNRVAKFDKKKALLGGFIVTLIIGTGIYFSMNGTPKFLKNIIQ